jgi:dihydrofolate reductase
VSERRASVFVGTSLDGFLARPDGSFDFLPGEGGGESHGFEEFLATIDALVMGRNTFEVVRGMTPWPYGTKPVFVLTSRPLGDLPPGIPVEAMAGAPAEIVAALATRGVNRLYVDGGITIQSFLRAGLIDRIVVTRVPVLIGTGIPLFGPLEHDVRLRHVSTRVLGGIMVQSEYEVVR